MNKLLIIDSDVAATQTIQAALADANITIQATADGGDGLALARLELPDCVILSVELQRGSGYSVCNKLRKDPQIAGLPLILVSQDATEETFDQHRKLKTHADYYIKKPYDMAGLLEILAQYLDLAALGVTPKQAPQPQSRQNEAMSGMPLAGLPMSDEQTAALDVDALPGGGPVHSATVNRAVATDQHPAPAEPDAAGQALDGDTDAGADDQGATRVVDLATLLGEAAASALATDDPAPPRQVEAQAPRPMAAEETQTYAIPAPHAHGAQGTEPPVAPRPTAERSERRMPPRRDTHGQTPAPMELLPDAHAEGRAAQASGRGARGEAQSPHGPGPSAHAETPPPYAGAPAPAPASRQQGPSAAPSQGVEVMRQEIRGLRQKVQELETALESAELAHADRLVEESRRGHDSVELKKKIAQLEREALKVQEAASRQKADWEQTAAALAEARAAVADGERGHLELVRQHDALSQEHAALQASHTELTGQMTALHAAHETLQQGHAGTLAAWQRARQAVDDTLQLIDNSGLIASM